MSLETSGCHRVALVVTGGVAVYKAVEVMRVLQKAGHDVRVCMTSDAERFVGKTTFEALSGHPVVTSLYGNEGDPIPHISLADWAELALVVPATGNMMAKMAAGIADDAASTALLAMHCPVLVAPAMNVHMWRNPATQTNLETLRERGVLFIMPESGLLACGEVGEGKLASVEKIVAGALATLEPQRLDLASKRVVVTAGPTHEAIDPVRYIANASTGKMGYAIAAAAAARGADVTLVSGPTALMTPAGVTRVDVVSAQDMYQAALAASPTADIVICAAAVADYTPAHPADHKLKKANEHLDSIELVETVDILAALSALEGARVVVGFAAETHDLLAHAQAKLRRKGCAMIVANDVSRADSTFGSDTDRVAFVYANHVDQLDTLPKTEVADELLTRAMALCVGKKNEEA